MARRRHHRRHRRRREGEVAEREMTPPSSAPSIPHFFKIVLSRTLESGKLEIPKIFSRRYGKDLSSLVHLKVPGGSSWPVRLEKSNGDTAWLWKGWREFMEHYSIDYGHLLVFKYEGDSVFHVIIFDKSASEIDYPLSIESDLLSPEDKFLRRKEEDAIEIENSEGFVPCSRPSSDSSSQEFGGQRPLTALELASQFESKHPFFKVVVRPSFVQKNVSIPYRFFREHVQKNKQSATLRYSDRSWHVKLKSYKHRQAAFLITGWSSFVRESGLHVRDVCVLELIDRDDMVFRVSIFSSDDRIQVKRSQCRESSLKSAFHTSPCLSPVTAREKASEFESEYPFCNIVISPSHTAHKSATIPWHFIKTYVQNGHQMVNLVYLGRSFEVMLRVYQRSHIAILGIGWSAFTREACLHKGDVCVFELINRHAFVFKVSIFRSADKESDLHRVR